MAGAGRLEDDALAALYRTHAAPLVRMLWLFLGDRAWAEDVAQEAFVRMHMSWRKIADPDRAGGYLRVTALNLARTQLRRLEVSRRHAETPLNDHASAEDTAIERADDARVRAALLQLPERQRACLVLQFFADLSYDDIAATMGISVNSVKTHLQRGRESLRELIGRDDNA